jgi:hypothetical protein
MARILVVGLLALALPLAASAAAVVESLKGTARAGQRVLTQGARFTAPTSIATTPGSQITLKFDDGMQIVLDQNSLMRILHFRQAEKGGEDRAVFELLAGAARVVTGKIAAKPKQFLFNTPYTELTVATPADFSVVLVNPAYIAVREGTLISTNAWGNTTLATGSTTVVESSAAAPATIAASKMPPSAVASMKTLQAAALGVPFAAGAAPPSAAPSEAAAAPPSAPAGGPAEGAPPTVDTASTPGIPTSAILIGVGVAAAALAAGGGGGNGASSTTQH